MAEGRFAALLLEDCEFESLTRSLLLWGAVVVVGGGSTFPYFLCAFFSVALFSFKIPPSPKTCQTRDP